MNAKLILALVVVLAATVSVSNALVLPGLDILDDLVALVSGLIPELIALLQKVLEAANSFLDSASEDVKSLLVELIELIKTVLDALNNLIENVTGLLPL